MAPRQGGELGEHLSEFSIETLVCNTGLQLVEAVESTVAVTGPDIRFALFYALQVTVAAPVPLFDFEQMVGVAHEIPQC